MHSCCSCYALVVMLLLLGEGIVGKFNKRKRTDKHRQTDFSNTRPMECRQPAAASGLCCLCQPPHRGREIDSDRVPEKERLGVVFLRGHILASQSSLGSVLAGMGGN